MNNYQLEKLINQQLNSAAFQDYAPNGLQVEGRPLVQKIITGVTACQALLDKAVDVNADAIIVHHGYFWKNEPVVICNMKRYRLKTLLANDINLYAYHLPLDAHSELGNNIQLGTLLGITCLPEVSHDIGNPYIAFGEYKQQKTGLEVKQQLEHLLSRQVLHCCSAHPPIIKRIAWSTGGAQDFIEQAIALGADAFITGEVSERTVHIAREMNIHFYAAGHHATERYGIKALGEWLAKNHAFDVQFIDIDNPV